MTFADAQHNYFSQRPQKDLTKYFLVRKIVPNFVEN